jgi:hypothetical protein
MVKRLRMANRVLSSIDAILISWEISVNLGRAFERETTIRRE